MSHWIHDVKRSHIHTTFNNIPLDTTFYYITLDTAFNDLYCDTTFYSITLDMPFYYIN